jgi:hypothetical protein
MAMTSEFPEWLPPPVVRVAQTLVRGIQDALQDARDPARLDAIRQVTLWDQVEFDRLAGEPDQLLNRRTLICRLAANEQMQGVWRRLENHKVAATGDEMARGVSQFRHRGLLDTASAEYLVSECGTSPRNAALALFFWFAYVSAAEQVSVISASGVGALCDELATAALQLRASADVLRRLGCRSPHDAAALLGAHRLPEEARGHAFKVESAAAFLAGAVANISEGLAIGHPLFVDRDHGNARARGYARALASEAKWLFGTNLYGTIAIVANVALLPKVRITDRHVINWCADSKAFPESPFWHGPSAYKGG